MSKDLTPLEQSILLLLRTMQPRDVIEIKREEGDKVSVYRKSTVKEVFPYDSGYNQGDA